MDRRSLRLVEALADTRHFGRAAERLGVAQPHLSTALKALERSLGLELFERRPNVRLTSQGALLLEAARRSADELDRALVHARLLQRGEHGSIRLAYASSALMTALGERLAKFQSAHPELKLTLVEQNSGTHWEELRRGRIDAALSRELEIEPGFKSDCVLKDTLQVALAFDHPMAVSKAPLDLGVLAGEALVSFRRPLAPTLHAQLFARCAAAGFTLQPAHEAADWPSILRLVALKFGVALVPAALTAISSEGLSFRRLADPAIPANLHFCYREEAPRPVQSLGRFLMAAWT